MAIRKLWQYDNYVDATGDRTGWFETPHVDAFQPRNPSDVPQSSWKQKIVVAAFVASMPFFFQDTNALTKPENPQIDKWIGYQQPIVYTVKKEQYKYPYLAVIDSKQLTLPENPQVDKWAGNRPDKLWDKKRQQYIYPSFFSSLSGVSNPTADKWHSEIQRPRGDRKRWHFSYPYYFKPDAAFNQCIGNLIDNFDAGSFSNNWIQYDPAHVVNANRQVELTTSPGTTEYYALETTVHYDLTGCAAYVQLVSAGNQSLASLEAIFYATIYPSEDPNSNQSKFYFTVNQNILRVYKFVNGVQSQVGGSITYNPATMSYFRIRESGGTIYFDYSADAVVWTNFQTLAIPFPIDGLFFAVQVGTYNPEISASTVKWDNFNIAAITLDKWFSETSRPRFDVKRQHHRSDSFFGSTFSTELITLDKWFKETERPRWSIDRWQHLYPSEFRTDREITTQEPLGNFGVIPEIIFRAKDSRWTYPCFFIDAQQLTQPENIFIDKWFNDTAKPVWRIKKWQHTYRFDFFDPNPVPTGEPITLDKWFTETSRPRWEIKRNQFTYPNFFVDGKALTKPENVLVDKWFKETKKPRWDIKRHQFLYPSLFDVSHLNPAKDLPIGQWSSYPAIIFRAKNCNFLYPSEFRTNKEIPTQEPLGDFDVIHEVIFRAKDLRQLYPTFFIDAKALTRPETVFPDKYAPNIERPRWEKKRWQFLYPNDFRTNLEIVTQEPLGDFDVIPEIIFRPKEERYIYPSFFIDGKILTKSETIYLDKWFKETEKPTWRKKRNQYLYPSFVQDAQAFTPQEESETSELFGVQNPTRKLAARWSYPYYSFDPKPITGGLSVDMWFRLIEQPIFMKSKRQYESIAFISVIKKGRIHGYIIG